jgi:hypothetical protein
VFEKPEDSAQRVVSIRFRPAIAYIRRWTVIGLSAPSCPGLTGMRCSGLPR